LLKQYKQGSYTALENKKKLNDKNKNTKNALKTH